MFRSNQQMAAARRVAADFLDTTIQYDEETWTFWAMAPNGHVWFTNGKRFIRQPQADVGRNPFGIRTDYVSADYLPRAEAEHQAMRMVHPPTVETQGRPPASLFDGCY